MWVGMSRGRDEVEGSMDEGNGKSESTNIR